MDDLLEKIITEFRSKPGQNLVVGISGIDGSGKSTLAGEINQALISRKIPVTQIALDDLLHPRHIRHENSDQIQGYFEDNFDYVNLVDRILDPALNSANFSTDYPVLDLETDKIQSRRLEFDGPGVVIVEGVFLFRKEISQKFHWKIWIDISFEDAMSRVLERSRDRRYGDVAAIRTRYETRFFPTQRFHLERDDPVASADFIHKSAEAKQMARADIQTSRNTCNFGFCLNLCRDLHQGPVCQEAD